MISITDAELKRFEKRLAKKNYAEMDRLMPELAKKARKIARRLK